MTVLTHVPMSPELSSSNSMNCSVSMGIERKGGRDGRGRGERGGRGRGGERREREDEKEGEIL